MIYNNIEYMVNDIICKVKKHQKREEYDICAKILYHAIHSYPENKSLRKCLGKLLIDTEQYDEAISILKKNTRIDYDPKNHELIGIALEKSKQYDKLETYLKKLFLLGYKTAVIFNLESLIAFNKKQFKKAEKCLEKALNIDSNYGAAYTNLGLIKIANSEVENGLELIEKGFSKAPYDPTVSYTYHSIVSEKKNYDVAEKLFQEAVIDYPDDKHLAYLYIDILIQQDKKIKAMKMIEKAVAYFGVKDGIINASLTIREEIGFTKNNMIDEKSISLCLIVKNEEDNLPKCLYSVKELVDEIIVIDTGSTDQTMEAAKIFGASVYEFSWNQNYSDARNMSLSKANCAWVLILDADEQVSPSDHKMIKDTIERGINDEPVAYSFTTRNYTGDAGVEGWVANKADYIEEKGIGWYPSEKVRLFPNLSYIRFENNIHETVEKSLLRENINILPIDVPIHHYGDLNRNKKQKKKEKYYKLGKKKLSIQKDDLKSLIECAIQANEVNDCQKAKEIWKIVLKKAPNYAKGFFNLGYTYIQLGDYKKAMRVSKKAIQLDPKIKEAFLNLSLCEMRTGNVRKSIRILGNFLVQHPNHPLAIGNLGVAYLLLGKKEIGAHCLQRLARKGFDVPEFLKQHVRDLENAGLSEQASALLTTTVATSLSD